MSLPSIVCDNKSMPHIPFVNIGFFFFQKFDDLWHYCFPISSVTIKSVEVWVGWMWYQLRLSQNKNREIWSHLFHRFNPLLWIHSNVSSMFLQAVYKMATKCRFICARRKKRDTLGMNFDLWWALTQHLFFLQKRSYMPNPLALPIMPQQRSVENVSLT